MDQVQTDVLELPRDLLLQKGDTNGTCADSLSLRCRSKHLSISSPEDESGFPRSRMSSVRGKEAGPAAPSNNAGGRLGDWQAGAASHAHPHLHPHQVWAEQQELGDEWCQGGAGALTFRTFWK